MSSLLKLDDDEPDEPRGDWRKNLQLEVDMAAVRESPHALVLDVDEPFVRMIMGFSGFAGLNSRGRWLGQAMEIKAAEILGDTPRPIPLKRGPKTTKKNHTRAPTRFIVPNRDYGRYVRAANVMGWPMATLARVASGELAEQEARRLVPWLRDFTWRDMLQPADRKLLGD